MEALEIFFAVLAIIESGGDPEAIGDGGESRGLYQIQEPYWRDGQQWLIRQGVTVIRARDYLEWWSDPDTCELIMWGYWGRYCPKALATGDWETLARVHNGGRLALQPETQETRRMAAEHGSLLA